MQTDETRDRQAALERLTAQYGTSLLRYYQGVKVDDVAQALRITRSGVKHRLKQANTVTFTTNEGIHGTLLGVYTVHVNGSTAVASWSYDGHAGDMDHWDASIIGSLSGGGCGICDEGSLVRTVSSIYTAGAFHGQGSDDAYAHSLYAVYPAPAQGGRSTL